MRLFSSKCIYIQCFTIEIGGLPVRSIRVWLSAVAVVCDLLL